MTPIESILFSQLTDLVAKHSVVNSLDMAEAVVAFSGGLDSSVLLHACVQLLSSSKITRLTALHVNHGLSDQADSWQDHCQEVCDSYQVPLLIKTFDLAQQGKTSELGARNARYSFFESCIKAKQILLVAHHQDDQVETALFRLFRGSGIHGMAGMPSYRPFSKGHLLRPFRDVEKSILKNYATLNQLSWVDDNSNLSTCYSRNFIRHEIVPLLETKWPRVSKAISKFSEIAREQSDILDEVAGADVIKIQLDENCLDISKLCRLSIARQKNLLHFWIRQRAGKSPASQDISEILKQVIPSKPNCDSMDEKTDKKIIIRFAGIQIRSFDGVLFLFKNGQPEALRERIVWQDISRNLRINSDIVIVSSKNGQRHGDNVRLRLPTAEEVVTVRARSGGEIAKPTYRNHSTSLKLIYQEAKIPPWRREWLPIIYYNDRVVAVPGVFVDQLFSDPSGLLLSIR